MKERKLIKFGLLLLYCTSVLLINPSLSFSNNDSVERKGNDLFKISEASDALKSPIQSANQIKIIKEDGRKLQLDDSNLTLFYSRPDDLSLVTGHRYLIDLNRRVQLKYQETDIVYPFHSFW